MRPLVRRFAGREIGIADPLQVLWDVRSIGGLDADQAEHALRTWLRPRLAPGADA